MTPTRKDRSPVSLTGLFTGQVWCENGYSPRMMGSSLGKVLYRLQQPAGWLNQKFLGYNLENLLLARHQLIDSLVGAHIEQNDPIQVVEFASGLSSRGMRMLHRFPDHLTLYLEADLPEMVEWKRARLNRQQWQDERHQLRPVNILRETGPLSPETVFTDHLDPAKPAVVITEGLLNYFSLADVRRFWQRLHRRLASFPDAWYIFELWPALDSYRQHLSYRGVLKIIELITRQSVPLHYTSDETIREGVSNCGFREVRICVPPEFNPHSGTKAAPCPFRVVEATA